MDDRQTHQLEVENVERMFARGFVIAGGLFWIVAAFAGPFAFGGTTPTEAVTVALWPFLATAVTLLIGWYYERLAAVLLFAGSLAVFAWGVIFGWEAGVWTIMSAVLIAPMVIAGVLFLLASHTEANFVRAEQQPVGVADPTPSRAAQRTLIEP